MQKFFLILFLFPFFAFSQIGTISLQIPELIPFKVKSKFGYSDKEGRIVIKTAFDFAEPFFEDYSILHYEEIALRIFGTADYATVIIKKKRYRIDKSGQIVYNYPKPTKNFLQRIRSADDTPIPKNANRIFMQDGKYGVKRCGVLWSKEGNDSIFYEDTTCIIIQPKYEYIEGYGRENKEPFVAKLNGKYGLIKMYDKIVISFKYDKIQYLPVGLLKVSKGNEIYYIDYTGREYKRTKSG